MTVYNSEAFIAEAIQSILGQTLPDFELLIFNDGSTDDTLAIIQSIDDERIRPFNYPMQKGPHFRRNQGIAQAEGKYIAIMDADDIALPQKLERQVSFLEQHPSVAIVGTQVQLLVDATKRLLRPKPFALGHASILPYMLFYCPFMHSTVMLRTSVLKNYTYPLDFKVGEDYFLWVQILRTHQGANLRETLLHYRIHGHNISQKFKSATRSCLTKIFTTQFDYWKIPYSKKELDLQLLLSDSNTELLNIEQLIQIRKWLEKLEQINKQDPIFSSAPFSATLQLVLLECWLWKVQRPLDYWNVRESLLFKSGVSWRDRWRLLRSFVHRLRKSAIANASR